MYFDAVLLKNSAIDIQSPTNLCASPALDNVEPKIQSALMWHGAGQLPDTQISNHRVAAGKHQHFFGIRESCL